MIKKNSLVWKHCVQIQTLTSLCKNSTSYLHVIFLSSLFQVLYESGLFLAGCPIFPDNDTTNVLFPCFILSSLL